MSHKPILADKGIGCSNNIIGPWIEHRRNDLEIKEGGVVHKEEGGLALSELFHSYVITLESGRDDIRYRHKAQKCSEEYARLYGLLVLFLRNSHYLIVAFFDNFDLHYEILSVVVFKPLFILAQFVDFFNTFVYFRYLTIHTTNFFSKLSSLFFI